MSNTRAVRLEWTGRALRFTGSGTEPTSPTMEIDGDNETAPGPMLQLLLAAAGCSGADVVTILQKMRVGLERLSIDVTGVRREEHPKRYTHVKLTFRMSGSGLDEDKAERAVALSLDKYCSVVHSLAQDITVEREIVIA
ncbi:MAG: OsmC family protein [Gemmatimonadota bacterium]|nr:MAG: OsmC family protein [Gemmatimonadota bacterium]